jgi:hypothetical protein
MAGQAAGHDEDGVDPKLVISPHEAGREPFRSGCNPAETVGIERMIGGCRRCARLHLDKGEGAAAAGDQIDFAAGDARALG